MQEEKIICVSITNRILCHEVTIKKYSQSGGQSVQIGITLFITKYSMSVGRSDLAEANKLTLIW